jgi:hypothetical protein
VELRVAVRRADFTASAKSGRKELWLCSDHIFFEPTWQTGSISRCILGEDQERVKC